MWFNVLLVVSAVLLLTQNISAKAGRGSPVFREYVEIENISYYVDSGASGTGFYRDDAKALCQSINMTMVRFESEDKWDAIIRWISDSDYFLDEFWNGALRDVGNTTWYWEQTGAEIIEFFWAPDQPSMDDNLIRSCIQFSFRQGGWNDNECLIFSAHAMCE